MTSRLNVRGPELRLSVMVLAVSLSRLAMAQPDESPGTNTAAGSTDTGTTTTPAASGSAPTEAAPATAAPAQPAPGAVTLPKEATGPGATKHPLAHEEVEPTPTGGVPLTVEILPGSGYPEPRIRGLVGGSLWFVMPGLQFPYMAPETSKNGTRIAISGYVWNDTSFARITTSKPQAGTPNLTRWLDQGVGLLRITPSYTTREGWFAMGNVELVGNIEQTVVSGNIGTIYDTWVRAGMWNLFDVTVGRFQGWEVYHYGMGLDYNTFERTGASIPGLAATQIYGVSTYWDRPSFGVGDYAVHFYPTDYLRFEVLGQIGTQGGNVQATRPVAILDLGFLKVKAGYEYGVSHNQGDGNRARTRDNGFGGAVQFVWNPYLEGGINGAIGYHDQWDDTNHPLTDKSTTISTYGGFLNGRIYGPLMLGVGANQTHWNNLTPNGNSQSPQLNGKTDYATHFQGFGAIQYSFWDKLFVKFVANYAKYHYQDVVQVPAHPWDNKEYGGRFRVMYLY